ncbi:MAG TPA: hypothetical protein VFE62_01445 [Gemmataceae bacterium]|nr:hypothetical protein [Gemmataceae bacterium]
MASLNQRPDRKFTVEIHFWEEICQYAGEFGRVPAEFIVYGENLLAGAGGASETVTANVAIWSNSGSEDATGRFGAIETLISERRLDLARYELDKLPVRAAQALPAAERYILLRLRAKLAMASGEFESAAKLFLEAYAVSPELEQAKQNQVLAYWLLGESDKASARAAEYVAQGLTSPGMIARLIETATTQQRLDEFMPLVDPLVASDEDINLALCHRYLVFGDYESARQAAERALQITPESPHGHLAAAMSIHSVALHGESKQRIDGLKLAIGHYDTAEPAARAQRFDLLVPEILVNRGAAKALIGDSSGAASDFRAAALARHASVYAARAVGFFLQEEDYTSARELLDRVDRATNEGKYLTLVVEHHIGDASEKRRCLDEMASLANQDWDRAVECRFQCVQWAIESKGLQLARSFVTSPFEERHAFQAHVMRAWISAEADDHEGAKEEAAKALDTSVQAAYPQELRVLAHILVTIEEDASALGLLEQIARPGVFDDDTKRLLACAQRLDRHDLLLRLCRELRGAGVEDDRLATLELQLLGLYAPRDAFQLADEFARTSPAPAYFVAFRNSMAVRLGELDKVNLEPSLLPTPAQLAPEEAHFVVMPFEATGHHAEAMKFLYAQRRLYFEDEHAHGRYIHFAITYGHLTGLQEPPESVQVDCAVLLDLGGGEQRWVVIEDDQPVASRDEFGSDSALAIAVLGKTPGSVITLPGKLLRPQSATVRDIQTKYVRAAQDSMQNLAKRFPDTAILQQFHVGEGDEFDPSVIIESLKGRREHVERCLNVYRDQPCSLFLLAHGVGATELEAMTALIRHPKGLVKCSEATPESFDRAAHEGIPSTTIVLDISAIITLTLADGWQFLDRKRRYLASQMTSELLHGWIHSCREKTGEGGVLTLDDADRPVLMPTTQEALAARLDELRSMRRNVDEHCEVASSVSLAGMDPETRTLYAEALGLHNIEAMSVAKDYSAALWSDDMMAGTIAKADFSVSAIWTQFALRCFLDAKSLTLDDFNLISAKLAAWNYVSTLWNAATIMAAGRTADWDTNAWPFSQCLGLIAKSTLPISANARIVVELLQLLRRSDCNELKQSAVIHATLNALDSVAAARWIRRRVGHLFGLDVISAAFVRRELQAWLEFRS